MNTNIAEMRVILFKIRPYNVTLSYKVGQCYRPKDTTVGIFFSEGPFGSVPLAIDRIWPNGEQDRTEVTVFISEVQTSRNQIRKFIRCFLEFHNVLRMDDI